MLLTLSSYIDVTKLALTECLIVYVRERITARILIYNIGCDN